MGMRKLLVWLSVLTVVLAVIFALSVTDPIQFGSWKMLGTDQSFEKGEGYIPPQPKPKPEDAVAIRNKNPFGVLVSGTDTGFEPREISVKRGETVRFTNNSHNAMWIAAAGPNQLYPAGTNTCGSSAFDSCRVLRPGDYWQFTFKEVGSWNFSNKFGGKNTGVIHVVP